MPDNDKNDGLVDRVVFINRVAKVVKGGRNFSFTAAVVVGDEQGSVGIGHGKAREVPEAIKKASALARNSMVKIPLLGSTIPHDVDGRHGAGHVKLMRARDGTGVIAGRGVRDMLECAGIHNVFAKRQGTSNLLNTMHATLAGLLLLRSPEMVAARRGLSVEELLA